MAILSVLVCFGVPLVALDGVVNLQSPVRTLIQHAPVVVWGACVVCIVLSICMNQWLIGTEWVRVPTALAVSVAALGLDIGMALAIATMRLP